MCLPSYHICYIWKVCAVECQNSQELEGTFLSPPHWRARSPVFQRLINIPDLCSPVLRRGGAFSLGQLKLAHEKGKTACSNSHTCSEYAPRETACARCCGPLPGLNHCGWLFMPSCPSCWPPTECWEGNAESPGSWSRFRSLLIVSYLFVTFRSSEGLEPSLCCLLQ